MAPVHPRACEASLSPVIRAGTPANLSGSQGPPKTRKDPSWERKARVLQPFCWGLLTKDTGSTREFQHGMKLAHILVHFPLGVSNAVFGVQRYESVATLERLQGRPLGRLLSL